MSEDIPSEKLSVQKRFHITLGVTVELIRDGLERLQILLCNPMIRAENICTGKASCN